MFTKGQVVSFFIVLAVIVGGAWQAISQGEGFRQADKPSQSASVAQVSQQQQQYDEVLPHNIKIEASEALPQETAFVVIDDGSGNPGEFVLELSTTTTAFELLKEACLTAEFAIESEDYDFGVLVKAINNKRNGQGGNYWLFYVNGGLSPLTPDKIQVNPGDKIEFKFAPH